MMTLVSSTSPGSGALPSVDLHVTSELLILVTDELDEFVVHHQLLIDAHGERPCIRLGIFDREIDFQLPEGRTTEALGEFHLIAVRTAVDVQPPVEGPHLGAPD